MHALRYLVPTLPLYVWLLPILICFWSPDTALQLLVSLIHMFYPTASAWSEPVTGASHSHQLQYGATLAILYWLVAPALFEVMSRKLTNEIAVVVGSAFLIASSLGARLLLAWSGYHVKVYIDF